MEENTAELFIEVQELDKEDLIRLGFRVLDAVILEIRYISRVSGTENESNHTILDTIQNLSQEVHNLTNALDAYTGHRDTVNRKIDIVQGTVNGIVQIYLSQAKSIGLSKETTPHDVYTRLLRYSNRLREK